MSELKDLFESFYSKLVLRDFFGKVIPGALVVGSFVYPRIIATCVGGLTSPWLWLLFIGLAWVAAFAIQALGEIHGWIRYYPRILECLAWEKVVERDPELKHLTGVGLAGLGPPDHERGDKNWQDFITHFNVNVSDPAQIMQRERLVVIKEACGNTYLAFIFTSLKVIADLVLRHLVDSTLPGPHAFLAAPTLVLALVVIYYLRRMHFIHVDRQFRFMISAVSRAGNGDPQGSSPNKRVNPSAGGIP